MNEMPECSTSKTRKARKDHSCSTCGEEIKKGSLYKYISGVWSGDPQSFKLCCNCEKVMDNFREMDKDLSCEDGPALDRGGVNEFLSGFICIGYSGIDAANDMSRILDVPLGYVKRRLNLDG